MDDFSRLEEDNETNADRAFVMREDRKDGETLGETAFAIAGVSVGVTHKKESRGEQEVGHGSGMWPGRRGRK